MVKDDLIDECPPVETIYVDAMRALTFLERLLPTQKFLLSYIDENDQHQFLHGELNLDEFLVLKGFTEMEMFNASHAFLDAEE